MSTTLGADSPIYRAGPDITMPVVVHEVKPEYTPAAMQKKIQGSVWVAAVIDQDGDVIDVRVTQSLDAEFGLDQEAVEATRLWKFKPAVKDGKPVHFQVTIQMTFTLK
jgi:TonB family protein